MPEKIHNKTWSGGKEVKYFWLFYVIKHVLFCFLMEQSFILRQFYKEVVFPVEKNKHENQPPATGSCPPQGLESSLPKRWGGGMYFLSFIGLSHSLMMVLSRFFSSAESDILWNHHILCCTLSFRRYQQFHVHILILLFQKHGTKMEFHEAAQHSGFSPSGLSRCWACSVYQRKAWRPAAVPWSIPWQRVLDDL